MPTRGSYIRSVLARALFSSWSTLDTLSTVAGLALPPLAHLIPALNRFSPSDLAWEIPVAVAVLLIPVRFFEAIYGLYRESEDERARLAAEAAGTPVPKVRIEYRNQLLQDANGKPLTLRNISDVVAVDVRVKTMQRGDKRATFHDPIPELRKGEPVQAAATIIGTDGSFGAMFADDFIGFLETTPVERQRAGGGLRSFIAGHSVPISIYFYDEDKERRFRADHVFTWDGPAGLITCAFERQEQVPIPKGTAADDDLD
jgi:hypothetical protein